MNEKRYPTFKYSIAVVGISMLLILVGVLGFKLRSEVLLCVMATIVAYGGWKHGYTWEEMENAVGFKIGQSIQIILMLWLIGMVIGSFVYSGTIPMVIYYGIKIISPKFLIFSAFLTCLIFSSLTGSAWSSAGTAGVAFMGMAAALNVPLHITAGAIIGGSLFGDKMSPLSETTNMSPMCCGTTVYKHIQAMLWTTVPPTVAAGIVYWIVGSKLNITANELPESTLAMLASLDMIYNWNIILLLPFAVVLYGAIAKKPANPILFFSGFSAVLIGAFYQKFPLAAGFKAAVTGFKLDTVCQSKDIAPSIASLLNTGGMTSMVGVIVVLFAAYAFAAIAGKVGFLDVAIKPLVDRVKSRATAIFAALISVFVIFIATGSSYIAFLLVPEMYKKKFAQLKLGPMVLSRCMEDIGTVFGCLIPWSSSGVFYVATLGVAIYGANGYGAWTILPYGILICEIICALTGIGVKMLTDEQQKETLQKLEAQDFKSVGA